MGILSIFFILLILSREIVNQATVTNRTISCECLPYYLCQDENFPNIFGVGVLDIRQLKKCDDIFHVCCTRKTQDDAKECGIRQPGFDIRITGNKDASFAEFPWMAAILLPFGIVNGELRRNVYQCGGSLIHFKFVLTAAHCVVQLIDKPLQVLLGEWDTKQDNEPYPTQKQNVSKVIIHEAYISALLYNDIALLVLEKPAEKAMNVDIICLTQNFDYTDNCLASGWGRNTFDNDGRYQRILKKIQLPLLNQTDCSDRLKRTRLGRHFQLHESFICAGGERGKDTCEGDGGSPLICPIPTNPQRYQQIGIVSWGIGCGFSQIPGVYTNVPLFTPWINDKIKQNT